MFAGFVNFEFLTETIHYEIHCKVSLRTGFFQRGRYVYKRETMIAVFLVGRRTNQYLYG